jgi:hypothetical protein
MNENLTDKNFLLYCASNYDNAKYASTEEFVEDLNRLKYIKKLITRYIEYGELKERLILNHIIVLNNCFGPEVCCKILYLKMKPQMKYIKPFLVLLNIMPECLYNINDEKIINTDLIEMDENIVAKLRKV